VCFFKFVIQVSSWESFFPTETGAMAVLSSCPLCVGSCLLLLSSFRSWFWAMDTAGKLEASDLFISSTYNIAFGAYNITFGTCSIAFGTGILQGVSTLNK
jgi:hypothetical protein